MVSYSLILLKERLPAGSPGKIGPAQDTPAGRHAPPPPLQAGAGAARWAQGALPGSGSTPRQPLFPAPQRRAAVPGSRTTFTRNLAPEALLSHRGACSPSSIHVPPPGILAALRAPCLHRLTQGHQNPRLPLPERKGVGGEGGTEDPTHRNPGPLRLGSRRWRAEIAR